MHTEYYEKLERRARFKKEIDERGFCACEANLLVEEAWWQDHHGVKARLKCVGMILGLLATVAFALFYAYAMAIWHIELG